MWAYKIAEGSFTIPSTILDASSADDTILQDVRTLKLTPNPAPSSISATATNASTDRAQFVCPFNLKEMNGVQPFVFIATCGCVMSQAGLKALSGASSSTPPATDSEGDKEDLDICPQCSTKYDRKKDVRMINPDAETEERMWEEMIARRAMEKSTKKSKKRKATDTTDESTKPTKPETDDTSSSTATKPKKARTGSSIPVPAPSLNPSIAAASRAVVSSLALEEAKRKANMSEAVKSLYESKNKGVKETFMTRGTFTRVSFFFSPC